ncbi:MAG: hypothetical protein JSR59_15815 [Proteobacteria bacterium]|nr:hypothetical protein [Pseudomonadota bacterium]
MHDEQTLEQMRRRLLDLQAALCELRDELCKMSLSLHDHAFLTDTQAFALARDEASALFRRMR